MQTNSRIVDAILKCHNWKLHKFSDHNSHYHSIPYYYLIDKNNRVVFSGNDSSYTYFFSLDDLCHSLKSARYIVDSTGSHENPYVGLTEEEILVKCDLEQTA